MIPFPCLCLVQGGTSWSVDKLTQACPAQGLRHLVHILISESATLSRDPGSPVGLGGASSALRPLIVSSTQESNELS
ncbi:hypothetical protein RRG08_041500 [Elysia crispata]|uniref:Uncharacterized protein n=1 Tax=Elysia crispata TaxID=231223 RepID=A0AAE0Y2U5_9GAST|nr:hypothetical protein RRG08_041500 [Elysia crispata]